MKLIIDVPEEEYEFLTKRRGLSGNGLGYHRELIANGTPLEELEDCVSRQAVLDTLEKAQYSHDFCKEHHIDYSISMEMVRIVLHDLPPVTSNK